MDTSYILADEDQLEYWENLQDFSALDAEGAYLLSIVLSSDYDDKFGDRLNLLAEKVLQGGGK